MRSVDLIVRDILVLKHEDKNNAGFEQKQLEKLVNRLDADISNGMLSSLEQFMVSIKASMNGADIGKAMQTMLSAVFKTIPEPKSVSMLGKLLFSEKAVDKDFALALMYRLLETQGLTIRTVPSGYSALLASISGNKLLDNTEAFKAEESAAETQMDVLKALFILNDEPDGDISCVKECAALLEYKDLIKAANEMDEISLIQIPDYTSYPNMALVMGLRVIAKSGKSIELRKETLDRFVMSILKRQAVDSLAAGF